MATPTVATNAPSPSSSRSDRPGTVAGNSVSPASSRNEGSLMFALAELQNQERDRLRQESEQRDKEAQREAEQRREQESARQRQAELRRLEAEQQARIAEAAARLRVVEAQRADALSRQAEELNLALRVSQHERDLLSQRVDVLADGAAHVAQRWRWRLAVGVAASLSLVLVGVLGLSLHVDSLRGQAQQQQQRAQTAEAERARALSARLTQQAQLDAQMKARTDALAQRLATLQRSLEVSPSPRPHHASGPQPARPAATIDLSRMAASCGDDPLCGLSTGGRR